MPYDGVLPGTLNAVNAGSYSAPPTGLSLPGFGMPSQQPQRELTLGQMAGVGLQGIGAATDIPRLLAYNLGPAMVGRPGQGPQTGAELFERLGMSQDSPYQRAAGAGLGAGLDMMANPLNLLGMGVGNRAAAGASAASTAADQATLYGRLGRMAGPELNGMSRTARAQAGGMNPRQPWQADLPASMPTNIPAADFPAWARYRGLTVPGPVRPAGFGAID